MWAVAVCAATAFVAWRRWRRSGLRPGTFLGVGLVYAYARLWHGWRGDHATPLPAKGGALLVANHTCSADPAFLQAGCPRPLSFLIAREYYLVGGLRRLFEGIECVPVVRDGRDVGSVRTGLRRLRNGRIVCLFPEGGLSNYGRPTLRRAKCGVALLALRSQAPVYPAFVAGGPQCHEVPRAWLWPSRVRVVFGPPVDLSDYYDRPITRRLLEEVTTLIMNRVEALRPRRPGAREG
jgi:1-acyl-sn-glycerol-3-phosphate acyltransferase